MRWSFLNAIAVAVAVLFVASQLAAQPLVVAGSPAYDSISGTGFQVVLFSVVPPEINVNSSGLAVGTADRYVAGSDQGPRAVRWDGTGMAATEMGNLGTSSGGITSARALAVNAAGTIVGTADRYIAGSIEGFRAVRWDAGGTAATELGNLGTDLNGFTGAQANAVNSAGTSVGYSKKYVLGSNMGERAVRWDASGTAATELGNLGTSAIGSTNAAAYAVNSAGTAVGYAEKNVAGSFKGDRAVRWDSSGTAATELGNLGTDASGFTSAVALGVNTAGMAVGYANKYVSGSAEGARAVRWDASGTVATELGNLGTDSSGETVVEGFAINNAGTAVGYSNKYVSGNYVGDRAVRWNASGTAATELGNLGTDSSGSTQAQAIAVNDAGVAVGYAEKYISGNLVGDRAVIWGPDGAAIDLNDLGVMANPTDGTWLLTEAEAISDNGWVAGDGVFTPNGGGQSYKRAWVAHVSLAVPEPGTMLLALVAVMGCVAQLAARQAR